MEIRFLAREENSAVLTFNILFMNSIYPDNDRRVLRDEMTVNLDRTNAEVASRQVLPLFVLRNRAYLHSR